MTSTAIRSKVAVLLLLSHCLLLLPLYVGVLCLLLVIQNLVSLLFLQASILAEEDRELVAFR